MGAKARAGASGTWLCTTRSAAGRSASERASAKAESEEGRPPLARVMDVGSVEARNEGRSTADTKLGFDASLEPQLPTSIPRSSLRREAEQEESPSWVQHGAAP